MLAEASLRVLEMVAVLLSILFVAVQFGARHATGDHISDEGLKYAMENVDTAATMLLFASMAAILSYMSVHGVHPAWQMLIPLFLALLFIMLSIRQAARELQSVIEESDDRLNSNDSQSEGTEESDA